MNTRIETQTYTDKDGNEKSYEVLYITLDITINGETRSVEFDTMNNGNLRHANSREVFGCKRGHGTKVHRTNGTIWYEDGEWVFDFNSGYALNKGGCRIVAWADQVTEGSKSQHVGTKIAKEVK